jgi:hypothetical protein
MSSSVASGNRDWKQKPLQRGKSSPADNKGDKLTKLATDRLLLREFVEDDWQAVLAYQSEAQYLKFSPWTHRTVEEVRDLVRGFVEWQGERPRTKYQLAITLRGEGQLIGNCGIRMESGDSRQANIGYEIAPGYWGEGCAGRGRVRLRRTATASYLGAMCSRKRRFLPGAGKDGDAKGGTTARGGVDERPMVGHASVRHPRSRMEISCMTQFRCLCRNQ